MAFLEAEDVSYSLYCSHKSHRIQICATFPKYLFVTRIVQYVQQALCAIIFQGVLTAIVSVRVTWKVTL